MREASPLIAQVHAHGDRRPYVTAIVAPSPIETLELGVDLGLVTKTELDERTAGLLASPTLIDRLYDDPTFGLEPT